MGQKTITGKVVDQENEPLIGVNVQIKNTTKGTFTDVDGNYSIAGNTGDTLVFSFTGYQSKEVGIGTANVISVTLEQGSFLDEVIVVGYEAKRK